MRRSYPVPHKCQEREMQGTGAGEVRVYQLSDEELQELRARTAALPTNASGKKSSKPIALKINSPKNRLTLEQYLQQRIAGKSKAAICKEYGIEQITLKTKLSKWGILNAQKEVEMINAYKTKAETP